MKEHIRIASGQGFWGDLPSAPIDQVRNGPIDYLVMDYLAEVTMSILQKQKRRDVTLGYARDFLPLMESLLPELVRRNITVITNAGGVNPESCCAALCEIARKSGTRGVKIASVAGDDILGQLPGLLAGGHALANMDTGQPLAGILDRVVSANVYFGAWPIVEALRQGTRIVVTGRTTDTGLTLAPMIAEFGWEKEEWNKMASGTVAGHILECGGQASGGNFSKDWQSVPDLAHIGFPIAEAYPDGSFVVTKHEGSGGLVSRQTVVEQLVYEIGDPSNYITADCVADFSTIELEEVGANRVLVKGIRGSAATEFYKVSVAFEDGYTVVGTLTYSWPDALAKAKAADAILRTRLQDLGLQFDELHTEFLGYDACHGPLAHAMTDVNEVVLRVGARSHDKSALERFSKEIAPLILTGPPSVTGFGSGRPKPSEVIAYWPALIRKDAVRPIVKVFET